MKKMNQSGFTLIEIVIVLVLLGILAATAVPKYFDLQKEARFKAAQSAVAEAQARLNGTFASNLLKGKTCSVAAAAAESAATVLDGDWTIAASFNNNVAPVTQITFPDTYVVSAGQGYTMSNLKLYSPKCE